VIEIRRSQTHLFLNNTCKYNYLRSICIFGTALAIQEGKVLFYKYHENPGDLRAIQNEGANELDNILFKAGFEGNQYEAEI